MHDSREAVAPVLAYLSAQTGLVFPPARLELIEQTLHDAMHKSRVVSPAAFLDFLSRHPAVQERLIADLTIGETYFFRHREQLQIIPDLIIPSLVEARSPVRPIRIWSAGCASGEEPYTLAIMLDQLGLTVPVQLLGTDISEVRLRFARQARYRPWSFRDIPAGILSSYFTKHGSKYELTPALKERVDFRHLNLVDDTFPSTGSGIAEMDLILCRNVLIYFPEDVIMRVAQRLIDSLSTDGWLMLGAADLPLLDRVDCDVVATAAGPIYRRRSRSMPAAPVAPAAARSLRGPNPLPARSGAKPARGGRPTRKTTTRSPGKNDPGPFHAPVPEVSSEDSAGVVAQIRRLADEGRISAAESAAQDALQAHPLSAELHALSATLLIHQKQGPAAATAARRAIYLDRSLVLAHVALADALLLLDARREAARALRNALRQVVSLEPDTVVPGYDDEPAGRLAATIEVRLRLLEQSE